MDYVSNDVNGSFSGNMETAPFYLAITEQEQKSKTPAATLSMLAESAASPTPEKLKRLAVLILASAEMLESPAPETLVSLVSCDREDLT